jgi:hypothetical protein
VPPHSIEPVKQVLFVVAPPPSSPHAARAITAITKVEYSRIAPTYQTFDQRYAERPVSRVGTICSLGVLATTACGRLDFDAQTLTPPSASSYADAVIADGPLGYWRLDDTTPALARDEMGQHDGSYSGACVLGVPGALGAGDTAVTFDAQTCEVDADTGPSFSFPNGASLTIELWADVTQIDASVRWLVSYKTPSAPDISYSLAIYDQMLWFEMVNDTSSELYMPMAPPSPGYHHIAVTVQPGEQRIYLDGTMAAQQAFPNPTLPPTSAALVFGHYARPTLTNFYGGRLDEIAIYDRALTQAEIEAHLTAR